MKKKEKVTDSDVEFKHRKIDAPGKSQGTEFKRQNVIVDAWIPVASKFWSLNSDLKNIHEKYPRENPGE